jgi:dTDP-4-dehydrorhamnose 3,5-epimerase
VQITPLSIEGAWLFAPRQHTDDRGTFLEWFKSDRFAEAVGHPLDVAQSNISTSVAGTVRGIHYADVPPGQAKYVTCVHGAVLDVVVDLRVGSPTFGRHELVQLDDRDRRAVYLSEGLGHGYMALTDGAAFLYLCSTPYAPEREHGVDPGDPDLAIAWPDAGPDRRPLTPLMSDKDNAAPSLDQALADGVLPTYEQARTYRRSRRA